MLRYSLAFLFGVVVGPLAIAAAPTKTPNVVVILADDLGYGDVQRLNPDRGKIKTPHLDKLAAQGMTFTDAHSGSSVCTPTRYGLLTGRYAWRTRLQSGVLDNYVEPLVAKDRLTLPATASGAGLPHRVRRQVAPRVHDRRAGQGRRQEGEAGRGAGRIDHPRRPDDPRVRPLLRLPPRPDDEVRLRGRPRHAAGRTGGHAPASGQTGECLRGRAGEDRQAVLPVPAAQFAAHADRPIQGMERP